MGRSVIVNVPTVNEKDEISEAQFVKELEDTPEKYIDEMQEIASLFIEF